MLDKEQLREKFLNQRSNSFTIVLNDDYDGLVLKNVHHVYRSIMIAELPLIFIAAIKHDRDISDDGHLKTPHYHLVLVFSGVLRIGSVIKKLMDIFVGLNEKQISIDKCSSVSAQVRYLIHLDEIDENKVRYDSVDIETNNRGQVEYYLKEIHKIVDVNDLIAIVREYRNLAELIRVIGIENYKKYRLVIRDLRETLL